MTTIEQLAAQLSEAWLSPSDDPLQVRVDRKIRLEDDIASAQPKSPTDRLVKRALEVAAGRPCEVAEKLATGIAVDLDRWLAKVGAETAELRELEREAGTTIKALGLEVYDPLTAADALESLKVALPVWIEMEELLPN
jgi:hypothetical protein